MYSHQHSACQTPETVTEAFPTPRHDHHFAIPVRTVSVVSRGIDSVSRVNQQNKSRGLTREAAIVR